ncbi:hypothetical protein ACQKWADRAFT_148046 [Trichoderma austrokoningii]
MQMPHTAVFSWSANWSYSLHCHGGYSRGLGEPIRPGQRDTEEDTRSGASCGSFLFFLFTFFFSLMSLLICIISRILGSPSFRFFFFFGLFSSHYARLHELDGLLILMGMDNRSISWRRNWEHGFFFTSFLGVCWPGVNTFYLFLWATG